MYILGQCLTSVFDNAYGPRHPRRPTFKNASRQDNMTKELHTTYKKIYKSVVATTMATRTGHVHTPMQLRTPPCTIKTPTFEMLCTLPCLTDRHPEFANKIILRVELQFMKHNIKPKCCGAYTLICVGGCGRQLGIRGGTSKE